MTTLIINERAVTVDAKPGTPLLWVLRDELHLLGTKYGCGKGLCGACIVHVDGAPVRSCMTPLEAVGDARSPPSRASPAPRSRRRAVRGPTSTWSSAGTARAAS